MLVNKKKDTNKNEDNNDVVISNDGKKVNNNIKSDDKKIFKQLVNDETKEIIDEKISNKNISSDKSDKDIENKDIENKDIEDKEINEAKVKDKDIVNIGGKVKIINDNKETMDNISVIDITYDVTNNKFIFPDGKSFTTYQLLKNIVLVPTFLESIENDKSKPVIEQFIWNDSKIVQSDFYNNIVISMYLFKSVYKFINTKLQNEISKFDICLQKTIRNKLKKFEFMLLDSISKHISIEKIRSNTSDIEKCQLNKYSNDINKHILLLLKSIVDDISNDYDELKSDIVQLSAIELNLFKKIDELTRIIKEQNEKINMVVNDIDPISSDKF